MFLLLVGSRRGEGVLSVSELLYLNGARERGLLGVVSLKLMMRISLVSGLRDRGGAGVFGLYVLTSIPCLLLVIA